MLDVPLENDLAAAVQRGFGRIDLRKNILARDVLVHHAVNGLHLTDDLFEPTVQIVGVHTLFHRLASIPVGYLHCTLCAAILSICAAAAALCAFGEKMAFCGNFLFLRGVAEHKKV